MSFINVEKFIEDIFDRPVIWNRSFAGNKPYLDEAWNELAESHKLGTVQLKAKWKGLRDMFRVEYKRIPRFANGILMMEPYEFNSKWIYYKPLLFLVDHMRSRSAITKNLHQSSRDSYAFEINSLNEIDCDQDSYSYSNNDDIITCKDEIIDEKMSDVVVNYSPLQPEILMKIIDNRPIKKRRRNVSTPSEIEIKNCNNQILSYNGISNTNTATINRDYLKDEPPIKIISTPELSISSAINNYLSSTLPPSPTILPCTIETSTSSSTSGASGQMNQLEKDSDYHFLLSLHPYMAQLSGLQKLRIRTKIQQMILQEIYDDSGVSANDSNDQ